MRIDPELRIVKHGPSLGEYRGKPIPAYLISATGRRSKFVRIATEDADGGTPLSQLAPNECVIVPGLIYRDHKKR